SSIDVEKSFYKTDWPVMIIASILLYVFIIMDGILERYEGIILFTFLIIFLTYLIRFQKSMVVEEYNDNSKPLPIFKIIIFLVLGGIALWGGSELLIKGAVNLAQAFGVSDRIIAVTVVSVGTS